MMKEKVINYFALNLSRKVNFSIPILQRQQTNIMSLREIKEKLTGTKHEFNYLSCLPRWHSLQSRSNPQHSHQVSISNCLGQDKKFSSETEESILCITLLNGTLNQLFCQEKTPPYGNVNRAEGKKISAAERLRSCICCLWFFQSPGLSISQQE